MSRTARSVLQVALAIVGLLAFLLLLDALFKHDHPIAVGLTDKMSRDLGITVMLGVLAVVFLLELTLVGRGSDRAAADEAEGGAEAVYLLGCPACGTVFEHRDDGNGRFRCTNCMREGRFHPGAPLKAPIQHHACTRCGHSFDAYKDPAQCPVCHLLQPVA